MHAIDKDAYAAKKNKVGKTVNKAKENWIDNIKIFACVLVALGHFFQSMCASGILNAGPIYQWFNQTIYYFHVPLFFICSGYLYQKYRVVTSFAAWKKNAIKKMLTLGIPYFVFSLITWGLKSLFSGSVNTEVQSLGYHLFIHPISPYWYLYALFFIFLITPTFSDTKACYIGLAVAGLMNILADAVDCYAVEIVAGNQIWFVIGMAVCVFDIPKRAEKNKYSGILFACLFLMLSIAVWHCAIDYEVVSFLLGLLACAAVVQIFCCLCKEQSILAPYTMPIFLMHTLFAAGFRALLLKLGFAGGVVHVMAGLIASFLCPILAAEVMKRTKLDFLFYPSKYLKGK